LLAAAVELQRSVAMNTITRAIAVGLLVLGAAATAARANFKTMGDRLPAGSNAIIAVNVEKVLATPMAQTEQWAQTSAAAWANQPLMIPPGASRVLMAAEVRTDSMEPYWELSLIEMNKLPDMKQLAQAERGHVDRIWDKDSVFSPNNAYFVAMDPKTLASITPANRAAIAKWLRAPTTQPSRAGVSSDYLQKVLAGLNDQTHIVMAMDLEGAFGVPRIRRWLDDNDIKGIDPKMLDEAARILGTMNGITLNVAINADARGRAIVDFDRDATMLAPAAKQIMAGVLDAAGMHLDDLDQWNFAAVGKQVTMDGPLSTAALRKLLSIVQSPLPAATVAAAPGAGAGADTNPADPAAASQRYYKAICTMLDNFRPGSSASESATWARATSKRIEQLPILNVDPQLVQWGALVTTKLKQAGAAMAVTQTQVNARVAGVLDPAYNAGYYDNDNVYHAEIARGELENANRQRRQAALEQKAQAQEQTLRLLAEIADTRPAIRQAMVEKYRAEF
jgi:hypothetical protein